MNEYREEHVRFHTERALILLLAARTVKKQAILIANLSAPSSFRPSDITIAPQMRQLISLLAKAARDENYIAVWWKFMPEKDLRRQMEFWKT